METVEIELPKYLYDRLKEVADKEQVSVDLYILSICMENLKKLKKVTRNEG